jgi:hypothetical protein
VGDEGEMRARAMQCCIDGDWVYLDFRRKAQGYIDTFGTYIEDIDGSPMVKEMYESRRGAESNVGW